MTLAKTEFFFERAACNNCFLFFVECGHKKKIFGQQHNPLIDATMERRLLSKQGSLG